MGNQRRKKRLTSEEELEVLEGIEKNYNNKFFEKIKININCKTPNQKKLVNEIRNKEITICSGLPGTGKAQPLDSMVLTPNGFIEMRDLKINDEVLTPDNKISRIIGIYPQGKIPIYKVTFSDGSNTECSSDHLWKTQTALDRAYQKFNRVDGKKIYYGEKGRDGTIKTTEEICNTLIYHGKTNHSIPITTKLSFNEKTLPIKPYLLGLLLGDGGLTTNVGFSTIDLELLEAIKLHLPNNVEYKLTKNGNCDYKIVTDRGVENPLLIELDKLGLRGLKSESKFIPNDYLYGSINDRISLLQGLMDTDGSIDKRNGSIVFYSTSRQLSDDLRFIVESLGGVCNLSQKIGSYKKDGVVIKCKVCYCLFISLPNDIKPFRLKRKLNLVKPKTKYTPKRFITNVEYIGDKEAQCIAIDDDSHLYLTNNFIVTHNTFLSCGIALELLKTNPNYQKIVIVKSVTTLKDEEIGYLKGPQPLYEKILTPYGWTTMGEIKIGDSVITESGEATKVIGVFDQENDDLSDIYRITLKDGRFVDCCINHKWTVKANKLDYFTVDTKFLINHIDKVDFYLPELKPVDFIQETDLPMNPYLLGVLLGDGCISSGHVRFCSVDGEITNKINFITNTLGLGLTTNGITHTITSTRQGTQSGAKEIIIENMLTGETFIGYSKDVSEKFNIKETTLWGRCTKGLVVDNLKYGYTGNISKSSNQLKEVLINLNLLGCKSYEKFIPQEYKLANIENRIELLRGLLDTDGTIKKNGEITYTTTSEMLVNDICELVWSLGGSARRYRKVMKQRNQTLNGNNVYQRRDCFTVTIRFSNSSFNPFYLSRKAERFKPTKSNHLKISRIEKINKSKIRCIKVESEKQLYVTRDFIVTHNTMKEKMEPFMYSFMHNFEKIIGKPSVEYLRNIGMIEELPIAYMRGINIDNSIVIIDECQNISIDNIRTIMTRLGENSKMIFLGDENQIDIKKKSESSLNFIINKFKDFSEVGTVILDEQDVVRNPLIKKIEQIFREK